MNSEEYMRLALEEAKIAFEQNEVPIGAVIVYQGEVIAKAHNEREKLNKTTAHAEILAIERACEKIGSWRLDDCDLYVTTEPCMMCAGTIIQARIKHVYYAVEDRKAGFFGSVYDITTVQGLNHYPFVHTGILEEECKALLKEFFKKLRLKPQKKD